MKIRRPLFSLFLILIFTTGLSALICYGIRFIRFKGVDRGKATLENSVKGGSFSLEKFSISEDYKGKKVFSLSADSFKTQRLKFGFFRIGLFKEASLKNLAISFYSYRVSQKDSGGSSFPFEILDFENVLKDNFIKKQLRNVVRFRISKVRMDIFHEDKRLSSITSEEAYLNLRSRDILFKGGVEIITDSKRLTCPKITYLRSKKVFRATCGFTLKTKKEITRGGWLETDYRLENITLGQKRQIRKDLPL